MFIALDTDASGTICAAELKALMTADDTPQDCKELFAEIDEDGSGHVTFSEWRAFMSSSPLLTSSPKKEDVDVVEAMLKQIMAKVDGDNAFVQRASIPVGKGSLKEQYLAIAKQYFVAMQGEDSGADRIDVAEWHSSLHQQQLDAKLEIKLFQQLDKDSKAPAVFSAESWQKYWTTQAETLWLSMTPKVVTAFRDELKKLLTLVQCYRHIPNNASAAAAGEKKCSSTSEAKQ
jgi:hypothetical protein